MMPSPFTFIKKWLPLLILTLAIGGAFHGLSSSYNGHLNELRASTNPDDVALADHLTLGTFALDQVQIYKDDIRSYTQDHVILATLIFILGYAACTALSLPIATVLTLLGGFLFGKWVGTLFVVIGATAGASILFLIARSSLGDALRSKAGIWYEKVEQNMRENAIGYLFFMRLVPIFPFFVVNIIPALFNIRLGVYVFTTFLGILPGTFVYVNLGQELGDITSLSDLVSPATIGAFALLGLFALIPTIFGQVKKHLAAKKQILNILLIAGILGAIISPTTQAIALSPDQKDAAKAAYSQFLSLYDGLLHDYTAPSQFSPENSPSTDYNIDYIGVNYSAWAKDDRHSQARAIITQIPSDAFTNRDYQLAYWINVYNFLTIDLITREGEDKTIRNLGGFLTSPWEKHEWDLAGKSYNLDNIEHDIIRKFGDARIHFAINCAAISCPDLRRTSYRGATLDQDLNTQVLAAFNNPGKGYRLDTDKNKAHVTKIMKWFKEDFSDGDLRQWLSQYRSSEITENTKIAFFNYHWDLNKIRQDTE